MFSTRTQVTCPRPSWSTTLGAITCMILSVTIITQGAVGYASVVKMILRTEASTMENELRQSLYLLRRWLLRIRPSHRQALG